MQALTEAQWTAVGRHVVSYTAGGATVFAGVAGIVYSMHGLSLDQVNQLSSAGKAFVSGITSVVGAVGTIASVLAAAWAAYSSSKASQAASVAAVPGTTIITSPELAASVPAANVVSNADVKPVVK